MNTPDAPTANITADLVGCARCDRGHHEQLLFVPFGTPVKIAGVTLTHWATCPVTGEPILMRMVTVD